MYQDLPVVTPRGQQTAGRGGRQPKYRMRSRASAADDEASPLYGEREGPHPIYVQEHLTKQTKDLLNAAKTAFTELNFEYPGYIKDGEVRVKKEGTDKPILIRSHADIKRIKDNDNDLE